MRLQLQQTIDKNLRKRRGVILFPSKQNLPFRGHREAFKSNNQGNFLESVKLLAKYSPVLNKHLSDIRISKKMTTTYLSPTIQNELVLLLSKKVKNIIL